MSICGTQYWSARELLALYIPFCIPTLKHAWIAGQRGSNMLDNYQRGKEGGM